MKNILLIATGGTIACASGGKIHLDRPFKILDFAENSNARFECISPFFMLSENMDTEHLRLLADFIEEKKSDKYCGIIILHGSDTLAYTAALLANIFYEENICLTAANKPLDEDGSNGVKNFAEAVDYILKGGKGVVVSYDGIKPGECITSADENDCFIVAGKKLKPLEKGVIKNKNVLVIKPYVGINYDNYRLDGVDAVLHTMYHSATVPKEAIAFSKRCQSLGIPFYFVSAKDSADYESASEISAILLSSTLENAYARLLLTL